MISNPKTMLFVAATILLIVAILLSGGGRDPKRLADRTDRAIVLRRWGRRCAFRWITWHRCRGPIVMDHQRPHSRGGRTVPRNLQPACARHNSTKGAIPNRRFVLRHTIPVVGPVVYFVRWWRAEVGR